MVGLDNITIGIPSFIRHEYLYECLRRIEGNLPECKVIVVDDSDSIPTVSNNTRLISLPFDSGLPAKRNASIKACETEYWYCGCDDYDFGTESAKKGILKLLKVLEENSSLSVAGGRFENNPYEGYLNYVEGAYIKETRLTPNGQEFQPCDLMANVFLARVSDISNIPWDERMKIGGEHGDWFLELKQCGKEVAWVNGVNINSISIPVATNPRYAKFRGRAVSLGHKIFLEKRNIKEYFGFDSKVTL